MIARSFVMTQTAATGWLAVAEPTSLTARLLEAGGEVGDLVGLTMVVLAVLALLDVVINDVLPEEWTLKITRLHHEVLYMACGATFLWQAFVTSASDISSALPLYYVFQALLCGAVSWRHGMGVYRERVRDRERGI